SDPYRQINPLAYQVDTPVGETDLEQQGRTARCKIEKQRHDVEPPEGCRKVDPDFARRRVLAKPENILAPLKLGERKLAVLQQGSAGGGKRQWAWRAMEQLDPKPGLKTRDCAAHGRLADPELPGSRGEALQTRHRHELGDSVKLNAHGDTVA